MKLEDLLLGKRSPITDFIINCAGIFTFFIVFGFLNEKLYASEENGQKFHFFGFVLFLSCVGNTIFGYFVKRSLSPSKSNVKTRYYIICSFLYIFSIFLANYSLKFLNYPARLFGRSCKTIAIVMFESLIDSEKYSTYKFVFVVFLSLGISIFFVEYGKQEYGSDNLHVSLLGIGIIVTSLLFEASLSVTQEHMKRSFTPPSHFGENMFYVNSFSSIALLFYLITQFRDEVIEPILFLSQRYDLVLLLLGVILTHACGQIFIFRTIQISGTLTLSVVNSMRKFFTILLSVFWHNHHVTSIQWICISLVFAALITDGIFDKYNQEKNKKRSLDDPNKKFSGISSEEVSEKV